MVTEKKQGIVRNQVKLGDCFDVMKSMQSESVDLIATNPPFNTGKVWERKSGKFDDRFKDIETYVDWMRERVCEMKRLLKPTGSFYLHCDQNASHYLKVMLDQIFDKDNFQNEIIWQGNTNNFKAYKYNKSHENILFYSKNNEQKTWNQVYQGYNDKLKKTFNQTDEKGVYRLDNVSKQGGGGYVYDLGMGEKYRLVDMFLQKKEC